MKKSKKAISLILGLVMCLALLAACGNGSTDTSGQQSTAPSPAESPAGSPATTETQTERPMEAEAPRQEANLKEHLEIILDNNPVAIINPLSTVGGNVGALWTYIMIYDRLLADGGGGQILPYLATEFHTDDYINFTFTLRDDVYFHNGDKFTVQDVINTIDAARDAIGTTPHDQWRPVASATAVGDYGLEIVLSEVNVDFLYNLTLPQMGMLNKRAMDADPENGVWIGTGAFKMTDFATSDFISVERNDDYWGQVAYTKSMTMRFIPEMSTRTIMIQNDVADVCFSISAEDLYIFENDPDNFTIFPITYNNPNTLAFNMDHPIAGDLNFRKAVAHAIDRAEVAIVAAGDWAAPVLEGTMWGYETPFKNTSIPLIPFDPDLAKQYLAESSYNGEVLELATAITTNVRASEIIQQQLSNVGINVEIAVMDPAGLVAYTVWENNQMEMMMFVTTFTKTPSYARSLYYPAAVLNRSMYINDRVTEILDITASVTDENERRDLFYELQEIVAEDLPLVNVFWRLNGFVGQKGLDGLILPNDNYFDFRYAFRDMG